MALAMWLVVLSAPAWATVAGLNQIATPDLQPAGVLTITVQDKNSGIDASRQIQLELGMNDTYELAVYHSLSPHKTILNGQVGLIRNEHFLVSAGLLGTNSATNYQPFVLAGYYPGNAEIIAGIQRQDGRHFGLFGVAYHASGRLTVASDYASGPGAFLTLGLFYEIAPNVTINPTVYISNSSPHTSFFYGSLSWDVRVW